MFKIDKTTKKIKITRGDFGIIEITATDDDNNEYEFQIGDVVRFKVFEKGNCSNVVMQKDVEVTEINKVVTIELSKEDTKIDELINRPATYWYEVELNPETKPQTIIGYDDKGEKLFVLYPEGDVL